jgi:PAS domain S-box-containing protein
LRANSRSGPAGFLPRLPALLQESPDALMQVGADGVVRYANPAGGAILSRFGCRVGGRLPKAWLARVRQVFKTGRSCKWETTLDERTFTFKLLPLAKPGCAGMYACDITEYKQVQETLAHELYLMNMLMDTIPDHIYFKDRQGRFLKVNLAKLSRSNLADPAQVVGKTDFDFFTAEHARQAYVDEQRIMQTGKPLVGLEEKETWPDGSVTWVHTSKACLRDKKGNIIGTFGISRDITRQKELQREILAISEREQRRIGHDLHDDLCQQLAGISFLSQSLAGKLAARSKAGAALAREIAQMARNAINQTRDMAHGLAPVDLEAGGLADALRNLAAHTQNVFHCDCRFHGDASRPLPDPGAGVHLYRIAQEAISNAIKHGRARRIEVRLVVRGPGVVLSVRDNGTGIPKKFDTRKGMGLRIMQYRAGLIGGALRVKRTANGGTTVTCATAERFLQRNQNGTK